MEDSEGSEAEKAFHGAVREYVVSALLFLGLYGASLGLVRLLGRRPDEEELYSGEASDAVVFRIARWLCTLALATALGSVLLLPFSLLANEVLLLYPSSVYINWLNASLVHSLWRYVFLLSNLSIFLFLPFAYFLMESQGLSGLRAGLSARVWESVAVCGLLLVLLCAFAHLVAILLDEEQARLASLFKFWHYQLPLIYSLVSLFGVSALLVCTPIGFARMFSVVGALVVGSGGSGGRREEEDAAVGALEELTARRRRGSGLEGRRRSTAPGRSRRRWAQWLGRLVGAAKYPLAMLALLGLTGLVGLMVVCNLLTLLVGIRSLPSYRQYVDIGSVSLNSLGLFGALVEILTIVYTMVASLVGLYSVVGLRRLRPEVGRTSMTKMIANSLAVLVLSSALPVLARTLGMSHFDLLGDFGRLDWLRNFYLVWGYNLVFLLATGLALISTFTAPLRRELVQRLRLLSQRLGRPAAFASPDSARLLATSRPPSVQHSPVSSNGHGPPPSTPSFF